MTTDVAVSTLFANMPAEYTALVSQLDPVDALNGGFNGINRKLGLKGSIFRDIINGKEEATWEARNIDVVVLSASKVGRTFFKDKWSEEAEAVAPTCWSVDGDFSAPEVPEESRQSVKCNDCPMNVKGSAEGDRRACRFNQRLAILLEEEIAEKKVYQLNVPAKSIFGDPENGKFPLQAYARHLAGHKTPVSAIVTKMSFDTNSATPKLFFSPVRPLTGAELTAVVEMQKHEDTIKAVEFTVAKPKPAAPENKIKHTETPHTGAAKDDQLFDDAPAVPETPAPVKNTGRKAVDKNAAKPEATTPTPVKTSSRKPVVAQPAAEVGEEEEQQPEVRVSKSNKPTANIKPEVESVLANWDDEVE
jgi:hypothetical protein